MMLQQRLLQLLLLMLLLQQLRPSLLMLVLINAVAYSQFSSISVTAVATNFYNCCC